MMEQSMVVIRDSVQNNNDCSSIFPPINHENLHIPSQQQQQQQKHKHPDASESGPPLASQSDSRVPIKWLGIIGFDVLRAKIYSIASSFGYKYNNGGIRGTFWSFLPLPAGGVAAAAAVTVMLWWWLRRRRRRVGMDRLMLLIKERDEKIIQLLHQIVQMNEVLLAHHKVSASKLAN